MKATGDTLRIRAARRADLDLIVAAEEDPENGRHIAAWTRDAHEAALADPAWRHVVFERAESKRFVGYAILRLGDSSATAVELKRIVVVEKHRGLGQEALGLIQQWVFDDLGRHRLWLHVKQRNDRARRCYESSGFRCEGVERGALRTPDGFESLEVMSVLSTDVSTMIRSRQNSQDSPEACGLAAEGETAGCKSGFGGQKEVEPSLRVLRDFAPDRLKEVLALYRSVSWGERYEVHHVEGVAESTSVFVGLEDAASGRVIAMARGIKDGTRVRVFDVIVAPGARGQGVGKRLLDALLAQPELRSSEMVTLTCRPGLEPFYGQAGFESGPINSLMSFDPRQRLPGRGSSARRSRSPLVCREPAAPDAEVG